MAKIIMITFKKHEVPQKLRQLRITVRNSVLQLDDFHISYTNCSDYDAPKTTALVFANQLIFFILKGDHRRGYTDNQNSFRGCLDYFLSHLDEASKFSDHLSSIDTTEKNLFNFKKECEEFMGKELYEYFCTRVKEYLNARNN